jgi:hypothetical protein
VKLGSDLKIALPAEIEIVTSEMSAGPYANTLHLSLTPKLVGIVLVNSGQITLPFTMITL